MSRRKLNANIPLSQNDVEELFMDDISDLPISVQQVIREHLDNELRDSPENSNTTNTQTYKPSDLDDFPAGCM